MTLFIKEFFDGFGAAIFCWSCKYISPIHTCQKNEREKKLANVPSDIHLIFFPFKMLNGLLLSLDMEIWKARYRQRGTEIVYMCCALCALHTFTKKMNGFYVRNLCDDIVTCESVLWV